MTSYKNQSQLGAICYIPTSLITYGFRESSMLKMKPNTGLAVKDCMEQEVAADCLVGCFHRRHYIARHRFMLIGVYEHQTMVVVTC